MKTKPRDIYEVHSPSDHHRVSKKDVCELLALIYADKPLNQLLAKYHFCGILMEYFNHRESRIIQLLISLATAYRLSNWRFSSVTKMNEKGTCVGSLFIDGDKDGVDLSIYEACNKIIHADEIAYSTRKLPKQELYYIHENIFLSGKKGKSEWVTVLWPVEFCEALLTMPDPLDEELNELIQQGGGINSEAAPRSDTP